MFLNACVCIHLAIRRSLGNAPIGHVFRRAAGGARVSGKCGAHVLHTVRVCAACALMSQRPQINCKNTLFLRHYKRFVAKTSKAKHFFDNPLAVCFFLISLSRQIIVGLHAMAMQTLTNQFIKLIHYGKQAKLEEADKLRVRRFVRRMRGFVNLQCEGKQRRREEPAGLDTYNPQQLHQPCVAPRTRNDCRRLLPRLAEMLQQRGVGDWRPDY